jgi:uncharacterized protein (TIGR02217 family)
MQKFIEKTFPSDISYNSSGGPEYNTEVLMTTVGLEYRQSKWERPKMRFNIATGIKNMRQMQQLVSFFRVCRGRQIAFRYKDWSDFKGIDEAVQIVNAYTLQLMKSYKLDDTLSEQRTILKPVQNTVKIYITGRHLKSDEFSVDYSTGIVTLQSPIESLNTSITADFEFDVPARFDTDYLPVTMESHGFFSLPEIPIIEIKT